jgi:L-asparaginase / beta-aspartyl-peptidase
MHAIAIHGGAGTLSSAQLTPENERAYRAGLERAVRAGFEVLDAGAASLDAVRGAVQVLEDDPLFNAGRGAVRRRQRPARTRRLGDGRARPARRRRHGRAHVRSPIALARLVMERSPHVMLAGGRRGVRARAGTRTGAEQHFATERRRRELERFCRARRGGPRVADGYRRRRRLDGHEATSPPRRPPAA